MLDQKNLDLCWNEITSKDNELLQKLAEDLDQDTLGAICRGIINTADGNYKFGYESGCKHGMLKGFTIGTISAISGFVAHQVITNTGVVRNVKNKIKTHKIRHKH